jgi:hypothetical protein
VIRASRRRRGRRGPARGLDRKVVAAFAGLAVVGAVIFVTAADDGAAPGRPSDMSSTTLDLGGLDIAVPKGWQPVPLPDAGFGLAVPPRWDVTLTSSAALDLLANRAIENPGFVDSAKNAAGAGATLYAAVQEAGGTVSDLKVQVLPRPGTTTATQLRAIADGVIATAKLSDATITPSSSGGDPVVTITYAIGGDTVSAFGTQVLRAGGTVVLSLIVTSETRAAADDLATRIAATLAFR